jgi:hypothetical protein
LSVLSVFVCGLRLAGHFLEVLAGHGIAGLGIHHPRLATAEPAISTVTKPTT